MSPRHSATLLFSAFLAVGLAACSSGPSNAQVVKAVKAGVDASGAASTSKSFGVKITGYKNHGCKKITGGYKCIVEIDAVYGGKTESSVNPFRLTKTKKWWVANPMK